MIPRLLRTLFSPFSQKPRIGIDSIPTLKDFLKRQPITSEKVELSHESTQQLTKKPTFHIETYGCQMNESDSEIVRALLRYQYSQTDKIQSDIVLINTCAIRQAAQQKIYHRINQLKNRKVVGILGCMAQRLKQRMFSKGVDIVCGPDSYRDLPRLIELALNKQKSINVQLSVEETYADIAPVRKNSDNVSAYMSIMRGCNNMCSFCIVPWVRGRERSRPIDTILREIQELEKGGIREVTFLGQNVNSYHDVSGGGAMGSQHVNTRGFSEVFKLRNEPGWRFCDLIEETAKGFPDMRFRFTSPHPKEFPVRLLETIAKYNNVCNHIHLPVQSGSSQILQKMRRNHNRQSYLQLVAQIRSIIPNVGLTTDLICGFCGQSQQNFQQVPILISQTLSMIEQVRYDNAYLFAYSMREKTHAHRNYPDDVSQEVKMDRLKRMVEWFEKDLGETYAKEVGNWHLVLVEKMSKRDEKIWMGRTDNFKKAYFARYEQLPVISNGKIKQYRESKVGDFVAVEVVQTRARVLKCQAYLIAEKLSQYYRWSGLVGEIRTKRRINRQEKQLR